MRGKGRESDLSITKATKVSVEFDPIITTSTTPTVLIAKPIQHVQLGKTTANMVGNCLPQAKGTARVKKGS